jgi:uncharacterized PurR-regulated membrane protein YhhQ (DUF165 family)
MLAALVLSYITSDPSIALASATAFAVSECIDWLVFSITKRRCMIACGSVRR